jgi:hypothetical protein
VIMKPTVHEGLKVFTPLSQLVKPILCQGLLVLAACVSFFSKLSFALGFGLFCGLIMVALSGTRLRRNSVLTRKKVSLCAGFSS